MSVTKRHYREGDSALISDFLVRHYQPGNRDGNWLQPTWEYALTHPCLDEHSLGCNTVWEDSGEIVGVVNYESRLGEAFFQVHPDHGSLKPAMLDAAEVNLRAGTPQGHVELKAYVNDFDVEFEAIVKSRGYSRNEAEDRPMSAIEIDRPVAPPDLPDGFLVRTLADGNDLEEMNRVLWRGFGHEGDPPAEEIEGRRKMQSGPNYRRDLAIVAVAPDGHFAAYCGMWLVAGKGYGYVEPLAADPDYRMMGLGRAVVTEGIRRCEAEGARTIYVGSDIEFYRAVGFTRVHTANCWRRRFDR